METLLIINIVLTSILLLLITAFVIKSILLFKKAKKEVEKMKEKFTESVKPFKDMFKPTHEAEETISINEKE